MDNQRERTMIRNEPILSSFRHIICRIFGAKKCFRLLFNVGMKIHKCSCSIIYVFPSSCSIILEKSVFVFVNVRTNTNEHQCLIYTCSSVTNIDEAVQSLNRTDVRFLNFLILAVTKARRKNSMMLRISHFIDVVENQVRNLFHLMPDLLDIV